MRAWYFILFFVSIAFAWSVPLLTYASTVWQSTPTHSDEVQVYTPAFINSIFTNRWFNETEAEPTIQIGTWNQSDFTTTASTSVHIWTRWNGSYINVLDVVLNATSGGNPFNGSGSTTAEIVTPINDSYYRLNVDATSSLQEYIIPAQQGTTIHQGNELWTFLYPSWAGNGANHWLGSNGALPYMELCEGNCDNNNSPPPDPCAATDSCVSNVLFLPGTEGSRLYYRGLLDIEHQVWEPDYHTDIPYLAMNADGTSKYPLYTKDIIDNLQAHNPLWSTITNLFGNNLEIYDDFGHFMDTLVASSTIKEWRAYPYDWRYDVRDIVQNGTPTEMPDGSVQQVYLRDVLDQLVASSTTKKVTIVAHSNGGLLAKALVLSLGADASKYIDRIIMVGTPQWGTPSAIGTMLHGDDGTNVFGIISSSDDVRAVAKTMPGPYGLLPTSAYFAHAGNPVATFDTGGLLSGKYATSFGAMLTSSTTLANFLKDTAGLNAQAGSASDLRVPLPLPPALVDKATATHSALDSWTPPAGITVTAIAGWGQDTVKTLAYTTISKFVCTSMCVLTPMLQHTPVTTQDGDSTVVSPSAVGNIGSGLYFNAARFRDDGNGNFTHQNLTSSIPIQKVVADLLTSKDPTTEQYIVTDKPSDGANPTMLRISSHSPVNLVVTDADKNKSGVLPVPGTDFSGVKRDIPDSSVQVFDDEEYISVPQSGTYQVVASGYATGSATLAVETIGNDGAVTATVTFSDIPTTVSSTATFSVVSGVPTAPAVDITGDGKNIFIAVPSSPTTDPLAYVRYMRAVIKTMSLSKNQNQIDEKLGAIEHQLAGVKKGSSSNLALLTTLARYVEQQTAFSGSQKGITANSAEIILGMINQLKTLL